MKMPTEKVYKDQTRNPYRAWVSPFRDALDIGLALLGGLAVFLALMPLAGK